MTPFLDGFEVESLDRDELKKMWEVYVCPTFSCNLLCPHCYLRNIPSKLNKEAILDTISFINENAGLKLSYDLFGGEPLLIEKDFLEEIVSRMEQRKYEVSTNLISWNPYFSQIFKNARWIDTSYNPKRFNKEQYKTWIENLRSLKESNFNINIMITLTKDYIEEETPERLCQFLDEFGIGSIDFDFLIGKDFPEPEIVEEFLLNMYENWTSKCKINLVEAIKRRIVNKGVFRDCHNAYTILPSGKIKRGCPYCNDSPIKIECKLCDFFHICNGACKLTTQCSFPKKLYERVLNEKE